MSILSRSLSRALNTGAPVARPKRGAMAGHEDEEAQPLRRTDDEEEEVQTLRRQEQEAEQEQGAQALRRNEDDEQEVQARRRVEHDGDRARPLRRGEQQEEDLHAARQAEDEEETLQARHEGKDEDGEDEHAQSLRRTEEAEELQARRPIADEDDEAQAARRQADDEEEALQAMSAETDPENAPPDAELVDAEAPSDLRAQRDVAPAPAATSPEPGMSSVPDPGGAHLVPDAATPDAGVVMPPSSVTTQQASERPRVSIDQIDVVIHEDGGTAGKAAGVSFDIARAVRARYLGGL